MPAGELPAFVARAGAGTVRWVWDDTTRWYPGLLAAGVRVARCTDLRLCHAVLRRSPFVDQSLLAGDGTAGLGRAAAGHRRRRGAVPARRPRRPARPGGRARPAAGGARGVAGAGAARAAARRRVLGRAGGRRDDARGAALACRRARAPARPTCWARARRPVSGRQCSSGSRGRSGPPSAAPGLNPDSPARAAACPAGRGAAGEPTPGPGPWSSSTTPASRRCSSTRSWRG